MSSITESIVDGVVRVVVDALFGAAADHVLKDQGKLTKIAGMAGALLIGEMVSEKASDWTNQKINEAIESYQEMAKALEEASADDDYEVR